MSDQERDLSKTLEQQPAPAEQTISEEDRLLLEKYSRSFTGTFAHTLDSKGRMVIPLAFRDMLGKVFTITPSFDFKSIAVYPDIAYVRMRESYVKLLDGKSRDKVTKFLQWMDAFTFRSQECDGQGRVLLPARLRQKILGEDKEVDIMGAGDHLNVAARIQCDEELDRFMADIDSILSEMNG